MMMMGKLVIWIFLLKIYDSHFFSTLLIIFNYEMHPYHKKSASLSKPQLISRSTEHTQLQPQPSSKIFNKY